MIITDSAGNLSIDPGGRILESITDNRSKKTSSNKTEKNFAVDSNHVFDQRLFEESDSTHAEVKTAEKKDDSHTFRINIPWWVYVFAALSILIYWKIWPLIKRLKGNA